MSVSIEYNDINTLIIFILTTIIGREVNDC